MQKTMSPPLCGSLLLIALAGGCQSPKDADGRGETATLPSDEDEEVSWLFVQTAMSGSLDGQTLTLRQVPAALMFSDRPDRITGHMTTERLIQAWDEGDDSFALDPPNAVLSTFGEHEQPTLATVELNSPSLEGDTLTYTIEVLDGTVPERFEEASLFIDNWGHGRIAAFGLGMASHGSWREGMGGGGSGYSSGGAGQNPPIAHGDSSYITYYTHEAEARERQAQKQKANQQKPRNAPQQKNNNNSIEAKLARLKHLHQKGLITDDEYAQKKSHLLAKM